jgi:hypothetical protein
MLGLGDRKRSSKEEFMERYRVYAASIYRSKASSRSYGLIGAELVATGTTEEAAECDDVYDSPSQPIAINSGRNVWDENNRLTNKRIFVMDVPSFPIGELVGKLIEPFYSGYNDT